jgi:ribosomal protein L7/L12
MSSHELLAKLAVLGVLALLWQIVRRSRRAAGMAGPYPPGEASDEAAADLARHGQKIQAIKMVRELHGCGLREARDWVEQAALVVGALPPPPRSLLIRTRPVSNEETRPAVASEAAALDLARRGKKIEAIKMIRQLHDCGLKEAKEWIEQRVPS